MATNDYTNIMLPGTKVRHKEYGFGSITEASEESVYVSFDGRIRIFPLPDAFLKGYISLAETNLKHDSYDGSASSNSIPVEKLLISDAFANLLDEYYDQFPARWNEEKYLWKAVQTFQDRWAYDASYFSKMIEDATEDASYLMSASFYYPRDMIVDLANNEPSYVMSMFKTLFDESIDIATRSEKFYKDADQIRKKYKGTLYSRNHQTMNAISTYLWLMYPQKYYFHKFTVAQDVAAKTGIPYKATGKSHVNKMILQFELMDKISAVLRQDDRSRKLLDPRLDKTLYVDDQLHCMAMDFAFFIRPCYENRKN